VERKLNRHNLFIDKTEANLKKRGKQH